MASISSFVAGIATSGSDITRYPGRLFNFLRSHSGLPWFGLSSSTISWCVIVTQILVGHTAILAPFVPVVETSGY